MIDPSNKKVTFLAALLLFASWAPPARALVISEIMYNPSAGWPEFIEIYNEDAEARDLSHYSIAFGRTIVFRFSGFEEGASIFLRGRSSLVVTNDLDSMLAKYPSLDNSVALFPAAVGPYSGILDKGGGRISLLNPGGALDSEVRYNNRAGWPSAGNGTGHSIIMRNADLDNPDDSDSWFWSPLRGGSPGMANFGETVYDVDTLITTTDTWKFFRGRTEASDPREAWRQPGYNDTAWEEGATPLGFPDACYTGTVISDMSGSYLSMYFRKTFEIADPAEVDILILKLAFDDGFIAYLNGAEVVRKNIAKGIDAFDAGSVSTSECTTKTEFDIDNPKTALVAGTNTLAIQVHNRLITDADFGFIPELFKKKARNVGGAPTIDMDFNELVFDTTGGAWLEIYNDQAAEQSLAGFFLTDDAAQLNKYAFPADARIEGHGFVVVDQAQLTASGVNLSRTSDKTLFLALSRTMPGLTAPLDLQVVDSNRFKLGAPVVEGMSFARFPDGNTDWVVARTATRGAANQFQVERSVVVNEIMYHPFYPFQADFMPGTGGYEKSEDRGEYIELYNRGDLPVNISGWGIAKGAQFLFPPNTTIPKNGYLVVARDPEYMRQYYGLPAEQVYGPWHGDLPEETAVLADSGEKVELQDELGNPADGVHYYDNGRWSIWADSRGSSLERIDPFLPANRASNWDASDESARSEWTHYSYQANYQEGGNGFMIMLLTKGIVLLDNIQVIDPLIPSVNYFKNGDFELPLAANLVRDGTHIDSGRITYDKKDGQACLKIIASGRGNNRIDCLRLTNPGFPVGRKLTVEFDAKWICGEATLLMCGTARSGEIQNVFAKRFFLSVPQKLGSPGRENGTRTRLPGGNRGPLVEKIRQTPVLPKPAEDVVMTAEVTDPDGIKDVKLKWYLDTFPAVANEIPMLDDGQAPDLIAGDGNYTAKIPGQAVGKKVLFEILATDILDRVGRFPVDERARTHPFILDPSTAGLGEAKYAIYIHGALGAQVGTPEYRIVMSDNNAMYMINRHTMNNDMVDSTLIWNDQRIFYDIGTRFGNSPWTRSQSSYPNPPSNSFMVKLHREQLLQGYKKFKLDNRGGEVNERAVYYLIRAQNNAGREPAPYSRSTYLRPFFNASPVGATFERVEVPGKEMMKRWYPDDSEGILYKLDDRFVVSLPNGNRADHTDATVRYRGEDPEQYRFYFFGRTRDKYNDFTDLIDLAKFFTNVSGDAYNQGLFNKVNVEGMIRTWAIEINVDDWDTWGTTRGKNCFIYKPRISGRWNLIAWDKDLTWGNVSGLPLVPGNFQEVAKLLNSLPGKRVYYSVLNDMVNTFYKPEYLNQFFTNQAKDKAGKAIPGVVAGASGPAGFVTSRMATIRAAIPKTQPKFELVTGGAAGVVVSTTPQLLVDGNAALTLWSVVVTNPLWVDALGNPQERVLEVNRGDLTWSATLTRWKTAAPFTLVDGQNDFSFVGFDRQGDPLGSDQLKVFYNVNWAAPQISALEPRQGPKAGGTPVLLRGSDFHTAVKVFFGAAEAPVVRLDEAAGAIEVTSPAGVPGPVEVKVLNIDGKIGILSGGYEYTGSVFNRGDADLNRDLDINDVMVILSYQFLAGTLTCLDAADANDDGVIDITDPYHLLSYMFLAGDPPAAPFDPTWVSYGEDPTTNDPFNCEQGVSP